MVLSTCAILLSILANAQIHNPAQWSFSWREAADKTTEIVITAHLEKGWHLYSQFIKEGGPVPTTFSFNPSADYELIGTVKEVSPVIQAFDKTFEMDIAYFSDKAVFTQTIHLKNAPTTIEGKVEFMLCDDEQCLPPDEIEFAIEIPSAEGIPASATNNGDIEKTDSLVSSVETVSTSSQKQPMVVDNDLNSEEGTSLWSIFLAGMAGGFAAVLMPCIFPMLPFTVSYFTKTSNKGKGVGKALIYAVSIIVIYVGIGLLVSVIFGADALNALSTNGIFNFAFFLLLVVFAASFLGAFELTLPSSWVNKMDSKSEGNGLLGIFFMAATLALVSFSCTGPIIGTLLVQAASMGEYMSPAVGMLGFAIALSIPFTIFAMFPSWLKSMPKSGGWLNSVKVVLGFLELALALKFLSNVDLAYHWNWLDREVFLVLWIVIFGMLGFYLLGKLRFPHDSEMKTISIPRLFLSIIVLSFTLYMVPGLWGAPLRSIAAFLPPQHTQDFDMYTATFSSNTTHKSDAPVNKKYGDLFHAPFNLDAFFDYDEGMAYAQKVRKPVLLDFTGHACVNCRKMEADVWTVPMVHEILRDEFVLIQLYVDDKTKLPEEEHYTSSFSGKKIDTIGKKWSDFQASVFGANSQPFYVLLDNEGKLLVKPQGANYNPQAFADFLRSGVDVFKTRAQ